jgi:Haem-binding domain
MKKKILLGFLALFIIIQFIRPEKNQSDDQLNAVSKKYEVPEKVEEILKVACYDCHSNSTRYPWYANVQPTAWWLAHHVDEGKHHLNFSDFITRPIAVQNHKFEEIAEEVEKKGMPMAEYTYLGMHPEAKLTDEQRKTLVDWAHAQMDSLKAQYSPDSLVLKRRSPPPPQ